MIFVGVDWSEAHHDISLMDEAGMVLRELRISDTLTGINRLHIAIAEQAGNDTEIVVGIETAHGLLPRGLLAARYTVYDINPLAASRYRDRHHLSGAKSDKADAKMLADLVRTDRQNHRRYLGDSELSESIKVLARGHKTLIWARHQQFNHLRSSLRSFFPAALVAFPRLTLAAEIDSAEGLTLLARAPEPAAGRALSVSQIAAILRRAGRKRVVELRAREVQRHLREAQLETAPAIAHAYGMTVVATVAAIQALTEQITSLELALIARFEEHPDAAIIDSVPGLGAVLGARVLGEFGDEPDRYANARARKNYAGTSPITKSSGTRHVVSARYVRNEWLADTCDRWAFASLTSSPGARRFYDVKRGRQKNHAQALRALSNRLVGILDGCLRHRELYREDVAWPTPPAEAAA
ncbi:MAG: IS110 family transposase [Acidimicrobiales bacterium]